MYNKLDLEYLRDRRWMQSLYLFHKIFDLKLPKYLYNLIPNFYATRNNTNTPSFNCKIEYFINYFFSNATNEWKKLDIKITNITSHDALKKSLLSFIKLLHFDTFEIHNPVGLHLLTRLLWGLSHFNEYKFKHNFRELLNSLCACNLEPETTSRYLLRCHLFRIE